MLTPTYIEIEIQQPESPPVADPAAPAEPVDEKLVAAVYERVVAKLKTEFPSLTTYWVNNG